MKSADARFPSRTRSGTVASSALIAVANLPAGPCSYHLIQCVQAEGGARAKERVLYFIRYFLPVG